MVHPAVLATALIAGVSAAVALELTVLRPLREGRPILVAEQFGQTYHEQVGRIRGFFDGATTSEDEEDDDEEGGQDGQRRRRDGKSKKRRGESGLATSTGRKGHHHDHSMHGGGTIRLRKGSALHHGIDKEKHHHQQQIHPADAKWRRQMYAELNDFDFACEQSEIAELGTIGTASASAPVLIEMRERPTSNARDGLHESFRAGMRANRRNPPPPPAHAPAPQRTDGWPDFWPMKDHSRTHQRELVQEQERLEREALQLRKHAKNKSGAKNDSTQHKDEKEKTNRPTPAERLHAPHDRLEELMRERAERKKERAEYKRARAARIGQVSLRFRWDPMLL